MSELVRARWFALFGMGAATVCIGYFVGAQAVHWNEAGPDGAAAGSHACSAPPPGLEPAAPTGRPSIQSPLEFDMHLDKSEWRLGITKLRRRLAAAGRGHVLEVALGTGRNLEFYDWDGIVGNATAAAAGKTDAPPLPQRGEVSGKEQEAARRRRLVERLKKVDFDRSRLHEVPDPDEEEDRGLRSYTGLDISPGMLDIALRRMRQVVPHLSGADGGAEVLPKRPVFSQLASKHAGSGADCVSLAEGRIRVLTSDAQASLPAPPAGTVVSSSRGGGKEGEGEGEGRYYDTIVQTFGLCSVRDPVGLVANLAGAVRPGTGRIVLLEHGRSSWWELVNGLLDRSARGHFDRFGCWWNRDVDRIVREAARRVPGLEVVRLDRPGLLTLGTHIWVELRLNPAARAEGVDKDAAAAAAAAASGAR